MDIPIPRLKKPRLEDKDNDCTRQRSFSIKKVFAKPSTKPPTTILDYMNKTSNSRKVVKRKSSGTEQKESDYDSEDSFIDDSGTQSKSLRWKKDLRSVIGSSRHAEYEDCDDEAVESSVHQQQIEKLHSSKVGALEDARELKLLLLEERKKANKNRKPTV